jgi:succinate dehydrogenase/fumarate reductase flavoprotein subunit
VTAALETDVLVIGSGASGFAAAITAKHHGLEALIIEKEPVFGGTSAWSGGVAWIPCNSHARAAGIADSRDLARDYIRRGAGQFFDADRVEAFLRYGPAAIDFLERETPLRFELAAEPDYRQNLPGALPRGRALRPLEFDGRRLGRHMAALRPPARERVLFLGLQIGAAHLAHFMNATRSVDSALFVAGRLFGHLRDVAFYGRGMRPAMGNALVAALAASAFERGIPVILSSPARELVIKAGAVRGARVVRNGEEIVIAARRGVILACGGFPHDYRRRQRIYPHHPTAEEHLSNAPIANDGDGLRLGETAGAVFEGGYANAAVWYPTSRVTYADRSVANHAHLLERGKPGVIAVTVEGKRFANEALNYHDFVQVMLETRPGAAPTAFYVCDHRALRRYGLGAARPFPLRYRPYLRTGYLKRGRTIEELAVRIGIAPAALADPVARYNAAAREGRDPDFGKGESVYDRSQGDPRHAPNPCIAPIEVPPFYAVKILPGDLGTFAGLRTDAWARALDRDGSTIPGLYIVGNDQASVFGGAYPGGGATIGPALTFGYVAARHLAGVA